MTVMIDGLWRFPLKGAAGINAPRLVISTATGVRNDRHIAIRRRPGAMTDKWAPKGVFHVCMNTPQMAIEQPRLAIGRDNLIELDPVELAMLRTRIGAKGEVQYTDGRYSLADTQGAFVSFLNLATVRALSREMGRSIDARRFRMNVWLTGLEPFEEYTWVDKYPGTKQFDLGEVRFRVDDACERCKAIEACPVTGEFDLKVQDALDTMMVKRGYKSPHRQKTCVMGILAAPLSEGTIKPGDTAQWD